MARLSSLHRFRPSRRLRLVGRAIFYAPALFGLVWVVLAPFLHPTVFNCAQLALATLFVLALRLDVGFGRFGNAFQRDHGWRLLLDHLTLLALTALMAVMAFSAPERIFTIAWAVLTPLFFLSYLLLASGLRRRPHEPTVSERL